MPDVIAQTMGLRERKKQRTRAMRVDDCDDCAAIMIDRCDSAFKEFTDIAATEVGSALPSKV